MYVTQRTSKCHNAPPRKHCGDLPIKKKLGEHYLPPREHIKQTPGTVIKDAAMYVELYCSLSRVSLIIITGPSPRDTLASNLAT